MRGKYRKRGDVYEYCIGDDPIQSCTRVAVALDLRDHDVLKHGDAEEVCEWVKERHRRLERQKRLPDADRLVAITLPASMPAEEINDVIQDPRTFWDANGTRSWPDSERRSSSND